ncbi:MAG: glycosyltransferase [Niabella sp.]
MQKRKILYFMPDSPVRNDAGNKTHTLQMLEYFETRHEQIQLDFVGEKYWGGWEEADAVSFKENFPHCNLYILGRKLPKKNKIKYVLGYKLPNYIKKHRWLYRKPALPNNNTHILQKSFNRLLKKNKYDYIIISYVTWATLIEKNHYLRGAKLINDTHDFITAQLKHTKSFRMGESFEREIQLLSLFDETWSQSADEQYLFSQFIPKSVHRFVPIMYASHHKHRRPNEQYKYDLIFVGSQNHNNIKSLNWFFDEVYPLLPKSLRICVIGKICDYIPNFVNVEKIKFAPDLDEFYYQAQVALCPMLSGTGVKVKTIEAFSYGLPVVCNLRGLDGLPLKDNNGCLRGDTPKEFANHIISLLNNDDYYKQIREQAINMFSKYFEKGDCYKNLDQIFDLRITSDLPDKEYKKKKYKVVQR